MNYYYIHQGRVLVYAQDISEAMDMSEDYNEQQKCHVTMTPEQIAFYEANKTATVKEVWDCELTVPTVQTNEDIEVLRQQAYLTESNPLMDAFNQYRELGETAKYEAKHAEWVAKVEEIRERYPYITE